ncbi:MAG: GTP pyrophosphokinase family protein [Longicatena sp.]
MVDNEWKLFLAPYEQAVSELKVKLRSIRQQYKENNLHTPIEFVTGRVKSMDSILAKSKVRNIDVNHLENDLQDIAGLRIMCQFVEDIYKVREIIRARHGKDMFVVEERDYISNLKPSGYRSYHMIIKYPVQTAQGEKLIFAEIQIRTLAMNFWATIEHSLRYKYKQNMPEAIQERLNKAAEAAHKLDQEMAEIREEVLKAQEGFQAESSVVADIFGNVQALAKTNEQNNMNEVYEMFWSLWEEGNVDKLNKFNKELEEKIRQAYQR